MCSDSIELYGIRFYNIDKFGWNEGDEKDMKIATVLFTYQRSEHLEKVLNGLFMNVQKPEKLFIFQDGVNEKTNIDEWRKVNKIIKGIEWCNTEVHDSEKNKGCAKSIIEGINYVLQKFDAVIVLEDDCVPHMLFMTYMYQALKKYKDNRQVYSVGGCAWDVDLPESDMDAYFNGRTNSWGWGTWKDRWGQFEEDYPLVHKLKKTEKEREYLNTWGADLESMVVGNITGNCDAWDVFWSLTVIKNNGLCLSPYQSLIHNIGLDGTGTHCTLRQDNWKKNEKKYNREFKLPDEAVILKECEKEFENLFSNVYGVHKIQLYQKVLLEWILMKQNNHKIEFNKILDGPIAIWGKGKICDLLIKELNGIADINCIIETYPSMSEYNGIPILNIKRLPAQIKTIIIIPYFDMEKILYKVKKYRDDIKLIGIDMLVNTGRNYLEES